MKTKFIHNKKRNTGFLFEVLVRGITQASLDKNGDLVAALKDTVQESFAFGTELGKELKLYRALLRQKDLSSRFAERLLKETLAMRKNINERKLFGEQSQLVNRLSSLLGRRAFFVYVPEYKSLATIAQLFHEKTDPEQRIVLEEVILSSMKKKLQETKQKHERSLDGLEYKLFVERFNEAYDKSLMPEQKKLLNEFILSSEMNGAGLKLFLNEELGRLKTELVKATMRQDIKNNAVVSENLKKVQELLASYVKMPISENMIKQVLQVQELVREIEKND
jgi:hypothetical protein